MNKKKKVMVIIFPIIILIAIFAIKFWAQCVEYTETFIENFSDNEYKDLVWTSVQNWPPAPITLNWLGANFEVTEPAGMGAEIYVCDAGDFDGDGLPDLIGLDIENNFRLILVRNYFEDNDGDGNDDDGIIFQIDTNEVYDQGLVVGPASITVADYNDDGLLDFFFYKNIEDEFAYTGYVAAMFINVGTETDPDFFPYDVSPNLDFTSEFMSAGIYCNWAADHLCSTDIDGDGDTDILVISEDKIFLVRNPGKDNFSLGNFEIGELNYNDPDTGLPVRTGFTIGRGGSSIDAADFDKDGDIDIVGGSVNDIPYLVYYENDGTGHFTRSEIPIPVSECTGTVATCVADFHNDGWIDIFGANDRWNAGNEARMWIMKSNGLVDSGDGPELEFTFICLNDCQPILPDPHDVDMSAFLDYDNDGDVDVILADANHSGDYYLIINELAPVYALAGEARSTDVAGDLDPNQYAVTKTRISSLVQRVLGGSSQSLAVELHVSNNGVDWELYKKFEGNEINNYSDSDWHTFNHYGSRLMWKALLSATEDDMEEYDGASFETPAIYSIELEFVYVERREYSRTSVIVTNVTDPSEEEIKKLVIGGTFYFPGWQGHLRAYDVSSMAPEASSYSELRTVTRPDLSTASGREIVAPGVSILWDAGELLDSRSPGSRAIYTAIPGGGSGQTRIGFATSNIAILGPILQDVNNDNEGLINFIRGEGRHWKLGDINHSNPIAVGPPYGNAAQMGAGYDSFLTANQNRRKVIYVGTNDGMIHCFDALTGEELWGFIPYNLLPKLRNMWAVDPLTGDRFFFRNVYVDGSPVSADVFIDADGDGSKEWRTILVCGQGPGKGSTIGGGYNYYFALDITNPYEPQPLWEFTDITTMGEAWSVPVIGKVVKQGVNTWAAFMGSGYDNIPSGVEGNHFYVVDLNDGNHFWSFEATDVDTTDNFPNIPNAIPGSPSIVDIDQDGFADRVYIADLDGRVWKVDVSIEFQDAESWSEEAIYTDSNNYPIATRPTVWINPISTGTIPRLYFGTGGDDAAPSDATYSFITLLDSDTPEVEWYLGDPSVLNLDEAKDMGDFAAGEKVWADPVVANYIVYFSTLAGNIESVDPCENLAGIGNLYARFIQAIAGGAVGGTALRTSLGTVPSLSLASKTRSAVTLGETEIQQGVRKREVYIQEYDSTIQKLEQPVGALLKIKSWREIFRIIR